MGRNDREGCVRHRPIDASFNAINKIVQLDIALEEYSIDSVTEGGDAQGEVSVRIISDKNPVRVMA